MTVPMLTLARQLLIACQFWHPLIVPENVVARAGTNSIWASTLYSSGPEVDFSTDIKLLLDFPSLPYMTTKNIVNAGTEPVPQQAGDFHSLREYMDLDANDVVDAIVFLEYHVDKVLTADERLKSFRSESEEGILLPIKSEKLCRAEGQVLQFAPYAKLLDARRVTFTAAVVASDGTIVRSKPLTLTIR